MNNNLLNVIVCESLKYNRKITSNNSMVSIEFHKDTPFYSILKFYKEITYFIVKENLCSEYDIFLPQILDSDSVLVEILKK